MYFYGGPSWGLDFFFNAKEVSGSQKITHGRQNKHLVAGSLADYSSSATQATQTQTLAAILIVLREQLLNAKGVDSDQIALVRTDGGGFYFS